MMHCTYTIYIILLHLHHSTSPSACNHMYTHILCTLHFQQIKKQKRRKKYRKREKITLKWGNVCNLFDFHIENIKNIKKPLHIQSEQTKHLLTCEKFLSSSVWALFYTCASIAPYYSNALKIFSSFAVFSSLFFYFH